jgi:hypothetical protein
MSEVMSYTESEYDDDESASMLFVPRENMSVASDISSVKRRRLLLENYKKLDTGYNKITRIIGGKKKSIEIYATGTTPGTAIRNAITGVRHNGYRVGSASEDVFYKVALSTGECSSRDACILFFDTPEQYERCMNATIDQPSKDAWYVKFNAYQSREYASRKY